MKYGGRGVAFATALSFPRPGRARPVSALASVPVGAYPANSISFRTVFMFRPVPMFANGMRSFD